jgi:hypothetical protein
VAKGAAATLTHTFYGNAGSASEAATDSSTTVTVAVTDATGASVTSGNATHGVTGVYTFALPGQSTLKLLTVTWSATINGAAITETDTVEIVGGFFFPLTEGRASDTSLSDTTKYPWADLAAALTEVEVECEWICDRAFVPRYRRVVLDGSGTATLTLPDPDIRTIRSVSVAPRAGQTFVALTSTELGALVVKSDLTLKRVDSNVWTEGDQNVIVEYEFGLDYPQAQLVKAAKTRFRSRLNINKTSIPDRASSYTAADGGTYRILLPDAYRTGIPEVDAVYSRYSRRVQANAAAQQGSRFPASRTLNYDPQRNALFHGGQR